VNRLRISLGNGTGSNLSTVITQLFEDILGPGPQQGSQQTLACSYVYHAVPPTGEDDDGLEITVPIFFMPLFTYSSGISTGIQNQLSAWIDQTNEQGFGSGATIRFDLTLFSTVVSTQTPPIARFMRLEYGLSNAGLDTRNTILNFIF
jgi:hypothetical protein